MKGLNVLITGSTSGIGLHTAKSLFQKGANVIVTCRDEVKGRKAVEEIVGYPANEEDQDKEQARVHMYSLDVTNYNSVMAFCDEVKRDFDKLHVIINNAGIMGYPFELSVDGIEMHFATNVFGHYVIVSRLLPLLEKNDGSGFKSRVIVVSSGLYKNALSMPPVSKLLGEKHWNYNARQAYAYSKLANCLYAVALSKMTAKLDVDVYCMRPGFVSGTELGRETHWILRAIAAPIIWMVAKSLDQGIDTIVYLAETSSDELKNGAMYYERKDEEYNEMVNTASVRQLWATLRHIEDLIWKRNALLTDEQKAEGEELRKMLDESLIACDERKA